MIHGIIPCIGHGIDGFCPHEAGCRAKTIKDQVLGAVAKKFFGHGLDSLVS